MSWAFSCIIPEEMFGVTKEETMKQLELFDTGKNTLPDYCYVPEGDTTTMDPWDVEVSSSQEESVLDEAKRIVGGARNEDYGTPEDNFARIATMWSVILGTEVTPRQVATCMIALKLARDAFQPKRDNLVDIAGYAQCAHTCGK